MMIFLIFPCRYDFLLCFSLTGGKHAEMRVLEAGGIRVYPPDESILFLQLARTHGAGGGCYVFPSRSLFPGYRWDADYNAGDFGGDGFTDRGLKRFQIESMLLYVEG